ncbi:MAG: hypothetical protein KC996_06495 [Phycisphaerales bacterium]|nr:hypothetical protein [Phycisphaerales bacterium]
MNQDQLRLALKELNGERHAHFALVGMHESASVLTIPSAMLIPEETDKLVKVTDGKSVYIIEAERIAYIRIGL